jgi:hypothetical protein
VAILNPTDVDPNDLASASSYYKPSGISNCYSPTSGSGSTTTTTYNFGGYSPSYFVPIPLFSNLDMHQSKLDIQHKRPVLFRLQRRSVTAHAVSVLTSITTYYYNSYPPTPTTAVYAILNPTDLPAQSLSSASYGALGYATVWGTIC